MNIEPTEQKQSISDDQELAKVLAGINSDASGGQAVDDTAAVPTPSTPMPGSDDSTDDQAVASADDTAALATPSELTMPEPAPEVPAVNLATLSGYAPAVDSALEVVKQQALGELRPLVDKLKVEPDEKFDIYLLLLRSTDDKDLIAPAHEAAKAIPDESKRAQALLDVIKEIDFLSQGQVAA